MQKSKVTPATLLKTIFRQSLKYDQNDHFIGIRNSTNILKKLTSYLIIKPTILTYLFLRL